MSAILANRLTVSEIVRVYERAVASMRGACAAVAGAEQLLNETFTMDGGGHIRLDAYGRMNFERPEDALLRVRHEVWRCVVDRLEVRRMMSVRRWAQLQDDIEKRRLPEITEESVSQLVAGFSAALPDMLAEAVEEVFDWLRPRRSRYKTNSELEVGEKVILGRVVEPEDRRWAFRFKVEYRADQNLIALENVFSALDGRGQIAKTHHSAIRNVIDAEGFSGFGETPYFQFRAFRNGNLHLWFRRADLLARFNALAGGRRLRPATPAVDD